jgi:ferredoxin-NADP reductase
VGIPEKFPMTPKELLKLIPHIKECDVFVCGPPGLAKLVRHTVESLGVKSRKFHHEAFSFHAE